MTMFNDDGCLTEPFVDPPQWFLIKFPDVNVVRAGLAQPQSS